MLRTVTATRYVTPLREGGSLPAVVEADDDGLYVLKFRGAGQGPKALVAELVAGEIGRALGLPVPELVLVEVDPELARAEPDPEIQDLVAASAGLNLALDYLPGSLAYDPAVGPAPDADLASAVVWFDALVTNVDRTARNTNLLVWHRRLWLIDHGAALYAHHRPDWPTDPLAGSGSLFPPIRDHVLLPLATALPAADAALRARLDPATVRAVLAAVPDAWFLGADPAAHRAAYAAYLAARLAAAPAFLAEAERARALGPEERPRDAGRRPAWFPPPPRPRGSP
jgi:hypothetical protein